MSQTKPVPTRLVTKAQSEVKASLKLSNQHNIHQLESPQPHQKPLTCLFTPSSVTTSTPAHAYATPLGHAISVGDADRSAHTCGGNSLFKVSDDIDELQAELVFARLLQSSYSDIMSGTALKLQEEEAMSQVYKLWQCVWEKKDETVSLKGMIETKETTVALEETVNVQLHHLGPVNSDLHTLEQYYSRMTKALNFTRHDMAYKRILCYYEDEINGLLGLSEHMLDNIIDTINGNSPTVSTLTDSTEALLDIFKQQYQELQVCWEEFDLLMYNEVCGTSLFFEQEQRKYVI